MNKVRSIVGLALLALGVVVFALGAQARPPSVKLGVVSQRYPWNGLVDVRYKAESLPESGAYAAIVVEVGETVVTNSIDVIVNGEGLAVMDFQAIAPETVEAARISIVADKTPSWPIDVRTKVTGDGTVTGGKQCDWGTETTLTAVPAQGFAFIRWSDGDTANPRTVTVDGTVYTAEFGLLTAAKRGAKADGYPYFDQTYRFATNGLDNTGSKYPGWAANFYVSFSKAVPAKTLKLATKCAAAADWTENICGDVLNAGEEYLVADAGTYGDLCNAKALDFAVWAYDDQNLGTTMTVWFKLTNGTEQVVQKLAEYTFAEIVKVVNTPSGITEPNAPYAIEMPVGSGYYVITNPICAVTASVITMAGLKGGETVQLHYLCNFVSNANENTTFLVMSYPKKTSKGAVRYPSIVIPCSTNGVFKGFNPDTKVFNTALDRCVGTRNWGIVAFTGDLGLTKPGAVKVSGTGGPQNVALTSVTIDDAAVTFVATGAVESVIAAPTGMTLSGIGLVDVWPQSNAGEVTTGHIIGYSNVTFSVSGVSVSTDTEKATYTASVDSGTYVDEMPLGDLVRHWVGLPPPPTDGVGTNFMAITEADVGLSYVLMRCEDLAEADWTTVSSIEVQAISTTQPFRESLYDRWTKLPRPQAFYKYQVAK